MSAYLRLVDANGNTYNFPPDFWLEADGWQMPSNVQHLAFGHGGRELGDGGLEARTVVVNGALRADSLAALETALRALQRAVHAGGKLYVSDDTVSRYLEVGSAAVDSSFQGDYRLEKPVAVSFTAQDPLWKADAETTGGATVAGDDDFDVDNTDSDVLVFPVIRFTADQGADLPSVRLTNFNDGGMAFEYVDPDFKQGDVLEIDSYLGTVTRNGSDAMLYFTQPNFLRLQPLVNSFSYEGNACTIAVVFRKVYL